MHGDTLPLTELDPLSCASQWDGRASRVRAVQGECVNTVAARALSATMQFGHDASALYNRERTDCSPRDANQLQRI